MYSSLGGLLVLAIAIGYYNFIGFGGQTGETHVAEMTQEDWWLTEAENLPVGNHWDMSLADLQGGQQAQTPPPAPRLTPPPAPSPDEGARDRQPSTPPVPSPSPQAESRAPAATPRATPGAAPEGADDDWDWDAADWEIGDQDEIYLGEDDGYYDDPFEVFDPAQAPQTFANFTEEDNMHWPVLGDVVMDFAMDRLVYDITLDQWRTNDNVAIAANRGDAVRAAASGIVADILNSRQFGPTVVIDHGNGWVTTYSQLDPDTAVSIGDVVTRGQIIGSVGSPSIFGSLLGYHVNFAITNDDAPINPHTLLTTAE
jgi:murein DD-endopeptidase MepM/ murein hydrolase activator NlpD